MWQDTATRTPHGSGIARRASAESATTRQWTVEFISRICHLVPVFRFALSVLSLFFEFNRKSRATHRGVLRVRARRAGRGVVTRVVFRRSSRRGYFFDFSFTLLLKRSYNIYSAQRRAEPVRFNENKIYPPIPTADALCPDSCRGSDMHRIGGVQYHTRQRSMCASEASAVLSSHAHGSRGHLAAIIGRRHMHLTHVAAVDEARRMRPVATTTDAREA